MRGMAVSLRNGPTNVGKPTAGPLVSPPPGPLLGSVLSDYQLPPAVGQLFPIVRLELG